MKYTLTITHTCRLVLVQAGDTLVVKKAPDPKKRKYAKIGRLAP